MMDAVNANRAPLLISLEDFKAFEETAYLMASPRNAERLNTAIAELRANSYCEGHVNHANLADFTHDQGRLKAAAQTPSAACR